MDYLAKQPIPRVHNTMELDRPHETVFAAQDWHAQGIADTLHASHPPQLGDPNVRSYRAGYARTQKSRPRQAPRKVTNGMAVLGESGQDGSSQHRLRIGMK